MKEQPLVVRVECYCGYRSEESPRRFFVGDRGVEVVEVLDRWLSPDHRYFKLRGDDGGVYILRHDAVQGHWELTLYDSGRAEATRLSST
jgi:hypothetical protein